MMRARTVRIVRLEGWAGVVAGEEQAAVWPPRRALFGQRVDGHADGRAAVQRLAIQFGDARAF